MMKRAGGVMKRMHGLRRPPGVLLAAVAASACASPPEGSTAGESSAGAAVAELDYNLAQLGKGYDAIQDQVKGECVEYRSADPIEGATGQKVIFSLDLVESSKEISRKLGVSAGASARFGLGSVDVKAQYVEEHQVSQNNIYAFVSVRILNPASAVKGARLSDSARSTLAVNPERFRERCGDKFIAATQNGGVFYGILEVETSNEQEKQSIAIAISGASLTFSASGSVNNDFRKAISNKQVHVWTYQEGGRGHASSPCAGADVQCLLKRAQDMPSSVADNPVTVRVSLDEYKHLQLQDDLKTPIDTEQQQEVQAQIADAKNDAKDLLFQIRTVLNSPSGYMPFDANALSLAKNDLASNLNKLREAASICYRDYTKCAMPNDLVPVSVQLPRRATQPVPEREYVCSALGSTRAAKLIMLNDARFCKRVVLEGPSPPYIPSCHTIARTLGCAIIE
ncbi:hypothetical protein WME75_26060 [Sorangium sp. So ce1014]|uniref:hypothetical protein n=1 Tax=Sorangium sp. So ce1014 TaxID=3133326 RepID=UPI003F5DBD95